MKKFILALALTLAPLLSNAALYTEKSRNALPYCTDKVLTDKVLAKISEEQKTTPPKNIVEKRHQILLLRDVGKFKEISGEGMTSKDDINTANKLITLKINRGIDQGSYRLCQSQGEGLSSKLYLLVYYIDHNVTVEVINYYPNNDKSLSLKFY